MKKMFFCVIPFLVALMGCVGVAPENGSGRLFTGSAKPAGNGGGIDLDAAIREAAVQMGDNLPGGTKVALVSMASSSAQLSEYVINRLEAALVGGRKLVVVDRANLDKVRAEQGFQLSGEVDDDSAKSIGRLLGAGAIVTGSFVNIGDMYSLTIKAINIETATVAVSYPADITKSERTEALLASGGGAGTGTRTAQAGGRAAAPAAPAKVYQIGDEGPAGGIVFYDKFSSTGGWRYLEVAPKETEQSLQWGDFHFGTTPRELGAGKKNTQTLVDEGKFTLTAARFCYDLEYGGYDDWYLPSRDELNLMYENLKLKKLGDFADGKYWSSSYWGGNYWGPLFQDFSDGNQDTAYFVRKTTSLKFRAIRQF
jgi:hypothetical protein